MAEPGALPQQRAVQRHGFAADMDLAQGTIGPWACCEAILQEQLPVGRGQVGQGNALGNDLPIQLGTVPQLRATQYHGGTKGQRRVQLLDETVEVQGGKLQHSVLGNQLRVIRRDASELTQCCMADGNPLGLACGAGGIDHIRQALGLDLNRQIIVGTQRQLRLDPVDVHRQHLGRQRQAPMQVRLGQHQAHTTVLKHMRQAFAGVLRVQRHIGRSCLEHREQADHHGKGALHGDPHQPLGADALSQQVMRQAVGLTVQFPIAEGLIIQGQGLTFRLLISLGFKQPVYSLKGGDTGRSVPVLEHPVLLSGTHYWQFTEAAAGCTHHRLQQVLPVLRQALDGGGVEQVGGVGQRGPKPVGGFMGVQAQVKMGGLAVPVQFHHTQAR
ncbi:hypothetical protein PFLuk1_02872 [Pseudomonas fluorescens]|nr:hypothetical protein PFLuk1_02872 [Pseudomonas fluorescens]